MVNNASKHLFLFVFLLVIGCQSKESAKVNKDVDVFKNLLEIKKLSSGKTDAYLDSLGYNWSKVDGGGVAYYINKNTIKNDRYALKIDSNGGVFSVGYSTEDFNFFLRTLKSVKANGFKEIGYDVKFAGTTYESVKDSLSAKGFKEVSNDGVASFSIGIRKL